MISTEFIAGRPFGGCAILYCKSLSKSISAIKTGSTRFCTISFTYSSISILMICVYLPTNYGTSQSHNLYLEVLGELKGFIDTQVFDNIIIAGDFNVDFSHPGVTCAYLHTLMNDLQLCAVDVFMCFNIEFTYERDDGLVRSWPDHVLTNCRYVKDISSIKCIHSPDNFSDHVPIRFEYAMSAPHLECCDTTSSIDKRRDDIDWSRIDPPAVERYQSAVHTNLSHLFGQLQNCSGV